MAVMRDELMRQQGSFSHVDESVLNKLDRMRWRLRLSDGVYYMEIKVHVVGGVESMDVGWVITLKLWDAMCCAVSDCYRDIFGGILSGEFDTTSCCKDTKKNQ